MPELPTLEAIRATRALLGDLVVTTPVRRWQDDPLERAVGPGTQVFLKEELFQRTGTFKPRGALSNMLRLSPEARARGVTAVSAGNHAMAVAYAARVLGSTAKVVMPKNANPYRVARCREHAAARRRRVRPARLGGRSFALRFRRGGREPPGAAAGGGRAHPARRVVRATRE